MSIAQIRSALFSFALLPFCTTTGSGRDSSRQEYPETIPALREWVGRDTQAREGKSESNYTFSPASRIVLDPAYAERLASIGTVLATDLHLLTALEVPIASNQDLSAVQEGDIVLTLDAGDTGVAELGAEGYRMEIMDRVTISAPTEHGVFNGTRTLLQLLKQGWMLRRGVARDWPAHPERSLMIDVGRKYFSLPWLKSHLHELAYLKYNHFHIHLSDTFGFRLQSERHPEIVSPQHYSKDEIRELIELARRYNITIVPEIDMPGHMDAILKPHPELQLTSSKGVVKVGDIDLTQDASYQLMRELLEEFLQLFPGPYWHIGADEYIRRENYADFPSLLAYARQHYGPEASARDTYLGFVNWANEIVKAHGKITRAWSDGLYGGKAVQVATDIIYEHWLKDGLTPQEIINRGLVIMNSNADHLYYVPGLDWQAPADIIYEVFEPHIFHDQAAITPLHQRNLGAKLHIWCDYPEIETENQIAEGITHSLRALSQKNWGSARLVADYNNFLPIILRIGHAPGYTVPLPPDYLTPGQNLNVSISETEDLSLNDQGDNETLV